MDPGRLRAAAFTFCLGGARVDDQQTSKGGRPVNPNSNRKLRTYREKLHTAGADLAAICAANAWARAHGVPLDPRAELLERTAPALNVNFRRVPKPPELHADQADAAEPEHHQAEPEMEDAADAAEPEDHQAEPELEDVAEPEPEPELEDVADPSVFPDLGGEAPPVDDGTPPPPPPPPPRKPEESYMGEDPNLVAACAQGPLFVLAALARLTAGRAIDLTQPVDTVLFEGTPVERRVKADPVRRMSELAGVAMARRVEAVAEAAREAGDAGGGKPGVLMEFLPLGLAFGAAVLVPSADAAKGAVRGAVSWMLDGARGAARTFKRRLGRGRG